MNPKTTWSRRAFLQCIGYTSACGMLSKWTPASRSEIPSPEIAYVASAGSGNGFSDSGIIVFEVQGSDWVRKQHISSRAPVSLALHPYLHVLYVANQIDEYQGLPRGTVEAYKINSCNGTLAFMNRQTLSLSGIRPKHIAVSPGGTHLVAAIHGGGAYNVLPIHADGMLGRVRRILKETGAGAHPVYQTSAHPHTVMFDAAGQHLFATDEGCDRLNVFAFRDDEFMRIARVPCRSASGPGHLARHPSGRFVYVSNVLDGSITGYFWNARSAEIREFQRVLIRSTNTTDKECHIAMSPSGRALYAASPGGSISAWEIHPVTGCLAFRQQLSLNDRSVVFLAWSSGSKHIFAVDNRRSEILSIPVHAGTGELAHGFAVAEVKAPVSLLMKSA